MTTDIGRCPSGRAAAADAVEPSSTVSSKAGIPNADERLAELLALEENWNSYNGRPVDRAVAERVRGVFPLLAKLGLSPWICPLSDGSLQIEGADRDDYCIEFNRDGTASVNIEGLSDQDAFGFISQFAMISALNRVAASAIEAPSGGETVKQGSTEGEGAVAESQTPNNSRTTP